MLSWQKKGQWYTAFWDRGSVQVRKDWKPDGGWVWHAFEHGAMIGRGAELSLAKAKAAAESATQKKS